MVKNKIHTKKPWMEGHYLMITVLIIATIALITMMLNPANKEWNALAENLTITIEDKDAYNGTIKLEKENKTPITDDFIRFVENAKDKTKGRVRIIENTDDKDLIIELKNTSPAMTARLEVVPINDYTINIIVKNTYKDEFDALDYEKVDADLLEKVLKRYAPNDMSPTVKQISDGVVKAKIRPRN